MTKNGELYSIKQHRIQGFSIIANLSRIKYSRNKTTYTKSPLCPKVASIYVIVLQNFFRN